VSEYRPRHLPARRRRRGRGSSILRAVVALLAAALLLLVGVAVGRALEDGPSPGGTRTDVRTLEPRPLPPAARTVTVTVTAG
jgi:hypothetical protein